MTHVLTRDAFAMLVQGRAPLRRASVAGLSVPLATIQGLPRSAQVGATSGDVVALNAQIDALNQSFAQIPTITTQAQLSFITTWPEFVAEWAPWEDQHKDDTISGLGALGAANNQAQAEFTVFNDKFNTFQSQFVAAFPTVPTPAKPFAPAPPVPNGIVATITGALGSLGLIVAGVAVTVLAVTVYSAYEQSQRAAPRKG